MLLLRKTCIVIVVVMKGTQIMLDENNSKINREICIKKNSKIKYGKNNFHCINNLLLSSPSQSPRESERCPEVRSHPQRDQTVSLSTTPSPRPSTSPEATATMPSLCSTVPLSMKSKNFHKVILYCYNLNYF